SVSQSNIGGPSPFWQQYAYDSVGNRTQKIVRTAAGATTTVNTFGGVASGPHRRVQSQTTSPSGAVVTNGFSFDGAGNQTSTMVGADQKTLGWDAEGELVSVSGGSTAESSVYDASGNRLIRTDAAGSTVFLPGGMEVKVTPANVVSATRWYTFGGRTVAYRNASGVAAMVVVIPDHQGTPAGTVAQSNWAAGVTRTRTDPFGAARSTATGTNGRGFLAATVDTTGLVALGARYYDPAAGVFVSVDPVLDNRNTAQFNAYVYSGNNPITWSDPSGLAWVNPIMRPDGGGSTKYKYRPGVIPKASPKAEADPAPDDRIEKIARGIYKWPLYFAFGPFVEPATAMTEIMQDAPIARKIVNGPATFIGRLIAKALGASCSTADNGLVVCTSARLNPGGGGTTVGEVFITTMDEETVMSRDGLLEHEQRHSAQWAGWGGGLLYPAAYAYASALSTVATGEYWKWNFFEWDAGLVKGRYVKLPSAPQSKGERRR
ncbi:MAG: hypothetical protein DI566_04355, partial [Microbacterium sp.]